MRITVVHSYYRSDQPSGENAAVDAHVAALRRAGHEVQVVARRSDSLRGSAIRPLLAAATVATGVGPSPAVQIEGFRPDVVHVHNLFPNFGRRWVRGIGVPIVHSLHNFRPLCAAGTLFRDGQVCTRCPDGDRWAGARLGCYRGSRIHTLPLAIGNRRGAAADPVLDRAAAIVVLSERARQVYEAARVPAWKIVAIPHYVPDCGFSAAPGADAGWLYAGRLSAEKGVQQLVERWPPECLLRVAGDGPLADRVATAARGKRVEILGTLGRAELGRLMRSSVGLVVPSMWHEVPLVYAEALAAGLPVLAFSQSWTADRVRTDGTGAVACPTEDLADVLKRAGSGFAGQRERCRAVFEREYTEAVFVGRMEELYARVLGSVGRSNS